MIDTKDLVFISKDEYITLVSKAAIYDAFARKLKADKDRNGYVSEYEQAMFVVDEPIIDVADVIVSLGLVCEDEQEENTEEGTISSEVWDEIEAMVDKEDNDAETV